MSVGSILVGPFFLRVVSSVGVKGSAMRFVFALSVHNPLSRFCLIVSHFCCLVVWFVWCRTSVRSILAGPFFLCVVSSVGV